MSRPSLLGGVPQPLLRRAGLGLVAAALLLPLGAGVAAAAEPVVPRVPVHVPGTVVLPPTVCGQHPRWCVADPGDVLTAAPDTPTPAPTTPAPTPTTPAPTMAVPTTPAPTPTGHEDGTGSVTGSEPVTPAAEAGSEVRAEPAATRPADPARLLLPFVALGLAGLGALLAGVMLWTTAGGR
jgi:hypothetical protein